MKHPIGPPPALPPATQDVTDPYAEIQRLDDNKWYVKIIHGTSQYGPNGGGWIVNGSQEKAEKKAKKELELYAKQERLRRERYIVTLDDI